MLTLEERLAVVNLYEELGSHRAVIGAEEADPVVGVPQFISVLRLVAISTKTVAVRAVARHQHENT